MNKSYKTPIISTAAGTALGTGIGYMVSKSKAKQLAKELDIKPGSKEYKDLLKGKITKGMIAGGIGGGLTGLGTGALINNWNKPIKLRNTKSSVTSTSTSTSRNSNSKTPTKSKSIKTPEPKVNTEEYKVDGDYDFNQVLKEKSDNRKEFESRNPWTKSGIARVGSKKNHRGEVAVIEPKYNPRDREKRIKGHITNMVGKPHTYDKVNFFEEDGKFNQEVLDRWNKACKEFKKRTGDWPTLDQEVALFNKINKRYWSKPNPIATSKQRQDYRKWLKSRAHTKGDMPSWHSYTLAKGINKKGEPKRKVQMYSDLSTNLIQYTKNFTIEDYQSQRELRLNEKKAGAQIRKDVAKAFVMKGPYRYKTLPGLIKSAREDRELLHKSAGQQDNQNNIHHG